MFLSFLAFLCLKDREGNPEEEFPTMETYNNTDEVEEPTENTGEMNNSFILKEAQNSNISVRSLGSNGPFSAGNHAITRGFVR